MFLIDSTQQGWRRFKRLGAVAGIVGAVAGAVVAVAKAVPVVEPWWYADRGYVRGAVKESFTPIDTRLILVEMRQNDARRERLLIEAGRYELESHSSTAQSTPQYRALIQIQIDRIKRELEVIEQDNQRLNRK